MTNSQTADVSEKKILFSELFFRQIRSPPQAKCSPTSLCAGITGERQVAARSRRHSQSGGMGAAKAPRAQQHRHGMPSHGCDDVTQLVHMPSDPTVTMLVASRWAHFNSTYCNILGGRKSCTR